MRKIIIFFSATVFLSSCSTFSLLTKQAIDLKAGTAKFNSKMPMIVNVELDSFKNVPMLFDTGASVSIISSDSIFDKSREREIVNFGKTKLADGKKFLTQLAEFKIKTPWFDSDNKVIALFFQAPTKCPAKLPFYGIIGIDAFKRSSVILELNFDRNEIISHYGNSNIDSLMVKDYVKIKSSYDDRSYFIYPIIFEKEHKMIFDTGNLSSIYLPSSAMPLNYKDVRIIDGASIKTGVDIAGSETFIFDNVPMKIGDKEIKSSLTIMKGVEISNVGMPFIQRFNWLIDFKNEEIWISKNFTKDFTDDKLELKPQIAMIVKDKIQIIAKLREAKFKVGDMIKAVDGEIVTQENNCRLLKKLNEVSWDKLNIDVE